MQKIPSTLDAWFQAILRPFMVFSIVGLVFYGLFSRVRGVLFIERFQNGLWVLYMLSIVVLFLGGIVQCACNRGQAARWTFGFVFLDIFVLVAHEPVIAIG